jgi:HlyD family secretion protein
LITSEVEFFGEVTEISPYAQESLSALGLEEERVKVTITPELPERLIIGPRYKVEVEFMVNELLDVIVIPQTALFRYEGEDALFVVKGNRARVRKVTTGAETRKEVVITSRLEEGDLVVLDPRLDGIDEGSRVSPTIIN